MPVWSPCAGDQAADRQAPGLPAQPWAWGSRSRKWAPALLSTSWTSPPWRRATLRAMARPRPLPVPRERAVSPGRSGRRSGTVVDGRDARSVVDEVQQHVVGVVETLTRTVVAACRTALSSRLRTAAEGRDRVAEDGRRGHAFGDQGDAGDGSRPGRPPRAPGHRGRSLEARGRVGFVLGGEEDAGRGRAPPWTRSRRAGRATAGQVDAVRVGMGDLELGAQRRQRALEVVGGVGDEGALTLRGLLEAGQHPVHGVGQPAHLVVDRRRGHPAVEVTLTDPIDLLGDRVDPSKCPADDDPGAEGQQREEDRYPDQQGGPERSGRLGDRLQAGADQRGDRSVRGVAGGQPDPVALGLVVVRAVHGDDLERRPAPRPW